MFAHVPPPGNVPCFLTPRTLIFWVVDLMELQAVVLAAAAEAEVLRFRAVVPCMDCMLLAAG